MDNLGLKLTFDLLPVLGASFSVLAWVLPGFKDWFAKISPDEKQLFMVGLLFVCTAVASLLSYFQLVPIYPIDIGARGLIWLPLVDFCIAVLTNAGVYKATNKFFEAHA